MKCPEVASVSGLGLMIGIELKTKKAADVSREAFEKGLLVLTAKEKVRLLPPLTITLDEINDGLRILFEILEE
jgi:acetylornithine/N-succinyldiaminopimelate aminotransferase